MTNAIKETTEMTYGTTFLVDKDGFLKVFDSLICHAVEADKNSVVNIRTDTT